MTDPLIGSDFAGRYHITRLLGAGGMGAVYAANQVSMGREVALKVLRPELGGSEAATQRFVREMQASSKIEHQNTIRVYDFGEDDEGRLYLAMELLDGVTLRQVLQAFGAMELSRLVHIAKQVCKALAAAHAEGIVHRDLKPENIMLIDRYGERDQVRVVDFGVARFAEGSEDMTALTSVGSVIGTPLYMSPEQATGQTVDVRSDLYALGVVLFHMATGKVPFTADSPVRLLYMHAHEAAPKPSEVCDARIPPRLEALILQLLSKKPEDRPISALAVLAELRKLSLAQTFVDAPTTPGDAKTKKRGVNAVTHLERGGIAGAHGAPVDLADAATLDGSQDIALAATMAEDAVHLSPSEQALVVKVSEDAEAMMETAVAPAISPDAALADAATADPVTDKTLAADAAPAAVSAKGGAEHEVVHTEEIRSGRMTTELVSEDGSGSSGFGMWLGLAAVVLLSVGGYVVTRQAPQQDNKPAVNQPAAGQGSAAAQAPAKAEANQAAPSSDRSKLEAALKETLQPMTPAACASKGQDVIDALAKSIVLLKDGRPRSQRAQDKRAVDMLKKFDPPPSAEFLAIMARAQLLAGGSDPAISTLAKSARDKCATMALAWEVEGAVHLLGQRAKIALPLLTQAVKLAPDFPRAEKELAMALTATGAPDKALKTIAALRARRPETKGLAVLTAQALLVSKKAPEAVATLELASKETPESAVVWYLLGVARQTAGDAEGAQTAYCKAAKLGHGRAARRCPEAAGMPQPK